MQYIFNKHICDYFLQQKINKKLKHLKILGQMPPPPPLTPPPPHTTTTSMAQWLISYLFRRKISKFFYLCEFACDVSADSVCRTFSHRSRTAAMFSRGSVSPQRPLAASTYYYYVQSGR